MNKGEDNECLGLSYTDTIPLLVAAIKEQQAKDRQASVQAKRGRPNAITAAAKSAAANPNQRVIATESLPSGSTGPVIKRMTGAQPRS